MSIYPGDRPLGRFITDREARKLEIFPELVEALELAADDLQLCSDEQDGRFGRTMDKILDAIYKAKGEMK